MNKEKEQLLNDELKDETTNVTKTKKEQMANEEQQTQEAEKTSSLWKELLSWVEIIVAAVLISLFLTKVAKRCSIV